MTADEFRDRREALGLSQGELAARLGMTRRQVNKIENGHIPIRTVIALAFETIEAYAGIESPRSGEEKILIMQRKK